MSKPLKRGKKGCSWLGKQKVQKRGNENERAINTRLDSMKQGRGNAPFDCSGDADLSRRMVVLELLDPALRQMCQAKPPIQQLRSIASFPPNNLPNIFDFFREFWFFLESRKALRGRKNQMP
jgi:hypothetical protein